MTGLPVEVGILSGKKKGRRLNSRSSAAAPCFSPTLHQLLRLAEKVAGILGAGGIGRCRDELELAMGLSWIIEQR
jgi:hypothetical protein